MQPLDDINPALENLPSALSPLEFIGAMTIAFIVAMVFQYIMSSDKDFNRKWKK